MGSTTNATGEMYKSVINDTVNAVREALLDEGVEPSVLDTLKKVSASSVVHVRKRKDLSKFLFEKTLSFCLKLKMLFPNNLERLFDYEFISRTK